MNTYQEALQRLQTAITDNQPQIAIDLLGRKTPSLPSRLHAYIHGYRIRLCKTLENDYPALRHYLGGELFDQHARNYVESTPSHAYSIDPYPIGFADYLRQHSSDIVAGDIAALESAIAQVFWLADSAPFVPDTDFSMEQLASLKLTLRRASKLLALHIDAETYIQAFRHNQPIKQPAPQPIFLYIVRHQNEVRRHLISATEHAVLSQFNGRDLMATLESALHQHPDQTDTIQAQIGHWLETWIANGFLCSR